MIIANHCRVLATPSQSDLALNERELHLWRAELDLTDEDLAPLIRVLSPDELDRAAQFHFTRDRRRFMAGRGLLRSIIAGYLHRPAHEISFDYGVCGKPALTTADLQFNLAHSGGLAIIGLTRSGRLGVDVERIRPLGDMMQLVNSFFSPRERQEIATLPAEDQQLGFFTCWTRKEAYLKAMGDGLASPLDQFDMPVVPSEPPRLLHVDVATNEAASWSLWDAPLEVGYVGTVAFAGQIDILRHGVWHRHNPGQ